MMNLGDMAYYAKNVIRYSAAKVKDYIRNFKSDDMEYICDQLGIPYLSFDEPWEHEDVFEGYKEALLRTQSFIKELQGFHKKYYQDYWQYMHGLSIGLVPMQNPLMKGDAERLNKLMDNPLEGGLQTFHQGTLDQYQTRAGSLPAMGLLLKPGTHKYLRELHDEGNLLFFTMHHVDINEIVKITEEACILLNVLWNNKIWRCQEKETDEFHRIAFPAADIKHTYEIGFPKHE